MSYALYSPHVAPFGAIAATNPTLATGLQALRSQSCYSADLDRCLNSKSGPTDFPQCAELQAAYTVDAGAMNAAAEQVPNCPEPQPIATYIAVGAFGLAAGLLIGALI